MLGNLQKNTIEIISSGTKIHKLTLDLLSTNTYNNANSLVQSISHALLGVMTAEFRIVPTIGSADRLLCSI